MIGPGIVKISPDALRQSPATLQVDVIADFVCPWSYLGKRRLDDALLAVQGPSVVSWFPFQLNPDMAPEGMSLEEYIAARYGDPAPLEPALAELVSAGKRIAVDFRFDRIDRVPNTLNAHRLMYLGETLGVDTTTLAETIMRAFFRDGLDIGDPEVLAMLGEDAGIRRGDVLAALEDDRTRSIVQSQEAQVRQSGVTGIPDFLVNKRLFVVGAQRTENLVSVFDRVMFGAESDQPVSPTVH